ncbi:MAG: hypothetical protein Hens2KO_27840 [Henriciella sp.]
MSGNDIDRETEADFSGIDEPETKPMESDKRYRSDKNKARKPIDDKTRVFGADPSKNVASSKDPMRDPPVAWLVVVGGAGRGTTFEVGYGNNSVGRGQDMKIRLNFDVTETVRVDNAAAKIVTEDSEISRDHFRITYDDEDRAFYIAPSPNARNNTKLERAGSLKTVLTLQELEPRDIIRAGRTKLLFVPLCGKEFDWKDSSD